MQSIDLIEKYAYGTSKDLVSKKETIKCNNVIKQNTMIENDANFPQHPDHTYTILIIRRS